MRTEQTLFNIIWLDDEIDFLYSTYKIKLRDAGIKVLDKGAHNVDEFKSQMQKYRNIVDAVVTDANFNIEERNDYEGLIDVSYLIKQYNHERSIPFIVFTGRDNLRDIVHEKTIKQFDEIVSKRDEKGIEALSDKIKEFVLKVNSKEFRIHNKYRKELKAASLIPGNEESLMNALLYEYSNEWKNTEDYFNPMRKIVESLLSACKREGIIPDVGESNKISNFLWNNNHETYVITQEIMPKPLARGLWYFLDITQDASHKKDELRLQVGDYVRKTQNVNLFRSVLYIAMDLCLWYEKCKEEMKQSNYIRKWKRKATFAGIENSKEEIQTQEYVYEGVVQRCENNGFFYCGRYFLEKPKDGNYQEGDTIKILKFIENNNPFENKEGIMVDRFVHLRNMKIG